MRRRVTRNPRKSGRRIQDHVDRRGKQVAPAVLTHWPVERVLAETSGVTSVSARNPIRIPIRIFKISSFP